MAKAGKSTALPTLRFPAFREAGAWTSAALHELADFVTDRVGTTECVPYTVTSGLGLVSQQQKLGRTIAGNSIANYVLLQRNDFAFNKSATKAFPQGYIARYVGNERAAVPNSIFTCFRVDDQAIIPAYLDYLFSSNLHGRWLRNYISIGARAHGSLNVNDDDLMALPVPLPRGSKSLQEQQKIVDCLTSLDEVIAAQGRKVEGLKIYKRGLMQQLFPREGATLPRLRFPEFRDGPAWEAKRIGDLKPFVTSGSRGWSTHYADYGSLFVRITNLSRESIQLDLADSRFVNLPPEASEGVRTQLKVHDVLISITADIGIVGYVDSGIPSPAYINQHIALVRFDASTVCAKFVAYLLASDDSQRRFRASTDNGAKAGMNLLGVQSMQLLLPLVPEQQRIASCLATFDDHIAAESRKLHVMKTYKKGLMQHLFPVPGEAL